MRRVGVIVVLLAGCSYDYERLRVHDASAGASGGGTGAGGSVGAAGGSGRGGTIGTGTAGSTGGSPTGTAGSSDGRGGVGGAAGVGVGGQGGTMGVGGIAGTMASAGAAGTAATAGTTGAAGRGGTTGSAGASGTGGASGTAGSSGNAGTGGSTTTQLTVKLKGDSTGTQWMTLALQITNGGTTSIPMSELTLRHWYTFDTTPVVAQADTCSYAFTPPGTCSNIVRTWVALSPSTASADFYYQVGFTAAAGSLNPGATADFQLQFHKNDWTNYTQTNDYSFNGATAFTPTTKVTAYRQGALVYGTEPAP